MYVLICCFHLFGFVFVFIQYFSLFVYVRFEFVVSSCVCFVYFFYLLTIIVYVCFYYQVFCILLLLFFLVFVKKQKQTTCFLFIFSYTSCYLFENLSLSEPTPSKINTEFTNGRCLFVCDVFGFCVVCSWSCLLQFVQFLLFVGVLHFQFQFQLSFVIILVQFLFSFILYATFSYYWCLLF